MEKAEFRNDSRGVTGVITIDPGGKERGIAVKAGETVWLTEEEQIATANAPRKAENNPFVNGTLTLVTEPKDIANRRPIGHSESPQPELSEEEKERIETKKREEEEANRQHAEREAQREAEAQKQAEDAAAKAAAHRPPNEETGLQVQPTGDGPTGERAQGEEVGTPTPAAKATPKPVKTS